MITVFEAYLLTHMRARQLVQAVLGTAGISLDECDAMARRAIETWGLDRPGYSADIFRDAIGRPVVERSLTASNTVPPFVGSKQCIYKLGLWPKVFFQVNQHPSGYAWGEAFVPTDLHHRPFSPTDITPWEWTIDSIASNAASVEVLDHWSHQKDVRLTFRRGEQRQSYDATFDFELLQIWRGCQEPGEEKVGEEKVSGENGTVMFRKS